MNIIYLDANWNIVDASKAVFAKVTYNDEKVVYGIPNKYLKQKEYIEKGGPGSGHHGHQGIPGQVGGSAPSGEGGGGKLYNELDSNIMQKLSDATSKELGGWGNPGSGQNERHGKTFNALAKYKGFGYKSINASLRAGKPPSRTANLVQDAISGDEAGYLYGTIDGKHTSYTRAPEDMLVYRAVGDSKAVRTMEFKPGQIFQDLGFSSTALRMIGAETVSNIKVMMRINVPKGSRGLLLEAVSGIEIGEYEWLLPMGSRFKVSNVSDSEGVTLVDMELLNE